MNRYFLFWYVRVVLMVLAVFMLSDLLYAKFFQPHDSFEARLVELWRINPPRDDGPAKTGRWVSVDDLAWPAELLAELKTQQSLVLNDSDGRPVFYGWQATKNRIWMMPLPPPLPQKQYMTGLLLFYSLIALIIFIILLPLFRDIYRLQNRAQHFDPAFERGATPPLTRSMLSPVADAFAEAIARVQNLVALQRDIAHAVSHDIRTPLSRIRFSLMSEPFTEEDKKNIVNDLDEVDEQVTEFLFYSRFEHDTPQLDIKSQSVLAFVETILAKYRRACDLRFDVNIDASAMARFDRRSFHRALQNLIDNAVRYAQSTITVSFHSTDQEYHLLVEDDGEGWQAQDDKKRSGLGLAIVEKICLWHRGSMTTSHGRGDHGARVILRWPK